MKRKVDSLPSFPRNAVPLDTDVVLTSEFEKGSGEPHASGRPISYFKGLFIKIMLFFEVCRQFLDHFVDAEGEETGFLLEARTLGKNPLNDKHGSYLHKCLKIALRYAGYGKR